MTARSGRSRRWTVGVVGVGLALATTPIQAFAAGGQPRSLPGGNGLIMFQYYAGVPALHTINLKSGVEHAVRKTGSGDNHPAYSPDGTKVAFSRDGAIWVMNANGKHQTRLTPKAGSADWPTWSPDGTRIAYSSNEDETSNADIYVMNADGSNHVRLTTADGTDYQPSWSVDNRIVFTSYRMDGVSQLFDMSADGSNQTDLTNDTSYSDSDPDWSPDGTTIVFMSSGRDHPGSIGPDLWTMSGAGTHVKPLIHQSDYSDGSSPVWSPNGRQIAFTANNGQGSLRIWVCDKNGSNQTQVAGGHGDDNDDFPTWQPTH